jgi:ABC-type amino acid transport substrate-binding protein
MIKGMIVTVLNSLERKALQISLFCIVFLQISVIPISAEKLPPPPEQFRKSPVIIEGDSTFPPFEYLDDKGQPAGFNVELTKMIMKRLGLTNYKIQLKSWSDVLSDYNNNKLDLIMGMMYTKERAKKYKFGPIHGNVYQDVIYRKGTSPIKFLGELRHKKVLVERGSINSDILYNAGYDRYVVPVDNAKDGLILLSQGEGDAMVCDHEMAVFLIYKLGINNLEINDLGLPPQEYCYVSKNAKMLDAIEHTIYDLKSDGTYEALSKKWSKRFEPSHLSHIIYVTLGGLFVCVTILGIFTVLLRKRVNKAKEQLDQKNRRLALALKAGAIGVWGYNVAGKRFYNVECDYFPDDGRAYEEELENIHPDDRQVFVDTMEKLILNQTTPKSYVFV